MSARPAKTLMATIAGFKVHPVAALFPLIEGADFKALLEDIKQNGQREPITLYQGKLLDGRNRARACAKAKIKPKIRNYKGSDPVGYAVSLNLARRHLTESQRAALAADLSTLKPGRPAKNGKDEALPQDKAASLFSTSRTSVQRASRVKQKGDPELWKAVKSGVVTVDAASKLVDRPAREQKKVVKEAKAGTPASQTIRELNRKDREKKMKRISKGNKKLEADEQYGVILADPSWLYDEGTTTPNRRIDNHYPPMTLEEICALPVRKLGLPDSVLFLWIPSPLLLEYGPAVLEAWNYDYKAQWIWHKEGKRKKDGKIGGYRATGYWTITEHEHVLICTRGDVPTPATKARFPSVFSAPVGEHSEKPEEVHRRIQKMYPRASKIELFARASRKGWSVWGNQSSAA